MDMGSHPKSATGARSVEGAAELVAIYDKDGALQQAIDTLGRRAGTVIRDTLIAEGERMEEEFHSRIDPRVDRVVRIANERQRDSRYAELVAGSVLTLVDRRFDARNLQDLAEHEFAYLAEDAPVSVTLRSVAGMFGLAIRSVVENFGDDPEFVQGAIATLTQLLAVRLDVITRVYQDNELDHEAELRMTEANTFRELVGGMLGDALAGSKQLRTQSTDASSSARGMLGKASEVAAAAEQSAVAMREAAQTAAGLIRAIEEARTEVELAAGVASRAGEESDRAVEMSAMLSEHAQAIESILRLIRDIAGQTNLLALNATIEAARAGDAGRGFAVVAQEVKSLASQTARATDDIAAKIGAIQVATRQTVEANGSIRGTIRDVQSSAERIRTAMETQAQTVTMITAAVDETALAADVMSSTIGAIRQGTEHLAGTIDALDVGFREVDGRLDALGNSAEDFTARLR